MLCETLCHFECRVSAAVRKTGIDASLDILRITGQVSQTTVETLERMMKDFDLALPQATISVLLRSRAVFPNISRPPLGR